MLWFFLLIVLTKSHLKYNWTYLMIAISSWWPCSASYWRVLFWDCHL